MEKNNSIILMGQPWNVPLVTDVQAKLKAELHTIIYDNAPHNEIMAEIRDFCNDPTHQDVVGLQQINAISNQLPVRQQILIAIGIAIYNASEHPKSPEEKFISQLSNLN